MFWFSLFQFLCLRWTFGKVELIWFAVQHPITQASYGLGVCEQGVWKGWKSSGWSPNGSIVGRESICACDRQRWRQHTHIVTTTAVAIRGQDQPSPCPWADSEACIHILLFFCFLISVLFLFKRTRYFQFSSDIGRSLIPPFQRTCNGNMKSLCVWFRKLPTQIP